MKPWVEPVPFEWQVLRTRQNQGERPKQKNKNLLELILTTSLYRKLPAHSLHGAHRTFNTACLDPKSVSLPSREDACPGFPQQTSSPLQMVQPSSCQPLLSHGTHKLVTKILYLYHTKTCIIFFCQSTKKNRHKLDPLTPDSYCYVGCCHIFIDNLREERSCP